MKKTLQKTLSSKEHDGALIAEVKEFLTEFGMTQADLSKRIAMSDGVLSSWMKGSYPGDVMEVEGKIRAAIALRRATNGNTKLVKTATVDGIVAFLGRMSRLAAASVLYGPHGCGKTAGVIQFIAESPTAIYIELAKWNGNVQGVERALMAHFSMAEFQKSNLCRGDFFRRKLSGTQRMILVDDAERLTPAAKTWLLDMQKLTNGSMVFVCATERDKGGKSLLSPAFATTDARTIEALHYFYPVEHTAADAQLVTSQIIGAQFPELAPFAETLGAVTFQRSIGTSVAIATLAHDLVKNSKRTRTLPDSLKFAAQTCGVALTEMPLAIA